MEETIGVCTIIRRHNLNIPKKYYHSSLEHIQRSAITGDLSVWYDSYDDSYDENHQLDLDNYECPNVRKANVEDYYSYDESYDDDSDEMVCCRNPAFYGKGKFDR